MESSLVIDQQEQDRRDSEEIYKQIAFDIFGWSAFKRREL